MKQSLIDKISLSNNCCDALELKGYSLQGRTTEGKIAVAKNGEIFTFKDYIEAHDILIKKK